MLVVTANRTFSIHDCQLFGSLSGDLNPLHVDQLAARRIVAGRVIVHGANIVLTAAEFIPAVFESRITDLICDFLNPVCIDDTVQFTTATTAVEVKIVVSVRGLNCAIIRFRSGGAHADHHVVNAAWLPNRQEPLNVPITTWLGTAGRVNLASREITSYFPAALKLLGETEVRAIAAISSIVGMFCPGLNSMSSSYHVKLPLLADPTVGLAFCAEAFDERFQLVTIRISGSLDGSVKAFVRPSPVAQPSLETLASLVERDAFAGQRVLIIGGTRGLGEVAAKLLAAGGAEIKITWAEGRADANRVKEELRDLGYRCEAEMFRAGIDNPDELLERIGLVTACLYFATPRIFRKGTPIFDPVLFSEFVDVYVTAFARLSQALDRRGAASPIRILMPSTTLIESRPKGLVEYAAAKLSAELLADDLNRTLGGIRILRSRLPRTATDQTASVVDSGSLPTSDVMLPLLRSLFQ